MARKYLNELGRIEQLIAQARRQRGDIDTSCLSQTQRDWFEGWREKQREYAALFSEPDAYYAATIEEGYRDPLPLRDDIKEALFGKPPTLPLTVTDDQAARTYWTYVNG
jgi:hypothetical protein